MAKRWSCVACRMRKRSQPIEHGTEEEVRDLVADMRLSLNAERLCPWHCIFCGHVSCEEDVATALGFDYAFNAIKGT